MDGPSCVWSDAFKENGMKTQSVTTCPDDGLAIFLSLRPRLFRIAYRMLASAAEAEDISRNASKTAPAKFLVVLAKNKGAPILTPTK